MTTSGVGAKDTELKQKLKKYRLSLEEYDRITELLGRPPDGVEWALFSALWSEHCSYKSSRVHFKKFFTKNDRVVTSEGENAGIIDLGEGERVAFKMESHNHPSFIEPYDGAATGVGGILRDIFTMGARPIALANYLCFGRPEAPRMSRLIDGVVRGIGGYGNCVGVPTVTGQTEFDEAYDSNILVNAMAVGLFQHGEEPAFSKARGIGNWVVYVGAKTGRDGIHGASMASESFADGDSQDQSKKPTIQKGDPYLEKLLIEACLEVMKAGWVVAIQDMGAAGLTSSSYEMSSKGEVGFDLRLDQVPLRDLSMGPEEILLSESQERMLLICEPKDFPSIKAVFERWDLEAVQMGVVTKGPEVRLFWRNEVLNSIDPKLLTENAPIYQRPYNKDLIAKNPLAQAPDLPTALGSPMGASREWIYDQYDQRVGVRTERDARHSVAVLRLPSGRRLGLTLGCRPQLMKQNVEIGAFDAIARPALQLAIKGFKPLAVTDCLNFGNPENPEVMAQFVTTVESFAATCAALDAPIISGNVSFYNETNGRSIPPTPSTGLVGLNELESSTHPLPDDYFVKAGDLIYLIDCPVLGDSTGLAKSVSELTALCRDHRLAATKLVGKFGLPYALAKMTRSGLVAQVPVPPKESSNEAFYQVIVVVRGKEVMTEPRWKKLSPTLIGTVIAGGDFICGSVKVLHQDLVKDLETNLGGLCAIS
jgi:phosphoribosylformylglycinamidine synthase subunit PurL